MTPREATALIITTCHTKDHEVDHAKADIILCDLLVSLGYKEVVEAWKKVKKFYT